MLYVNAEDLDFAMAHRMGGILADALERGDLRSDYRDRMRQMAEEFNDCIVSLGVRGYCQPPPPMWPEETLCST